MAKKLTLKLPGHEYEPEPPAPQPLPEGKPVPRLTLKLPGMPAPAPPQVWADDPGSVEAFEFLEELPQLKEQERQAQTIRRQAKAYKTSLISGAFAPPPEHLERIAKFTPEQFKERGKKYWMGRGVSGEELEKRATNYMEQQLKRRELWLPRLQREHEARQQALAEAEAAGGVAPPGETYPPPEEHMPMVWGPEHGPTLAAIYKETGRLPDPEEARQYVKPKKRLTLKTSAFKQEEPLLGTGGAVAGGALGLVTGGVPGAVAGAAGGREIGRALETGEPQFAPAKAAGLAWEIVEKFRRPGRAAIDVYAGSLEELRKIAGDLPPPEGQEATFQYRAMAPMVGGLSGGQIKPQVFAHHYPWSGRVFDVPVKEAVEKIFFELEGPKRALAVAEAGLEYGWEALTTDNPEIAQDMSHFLTGIQERYYAEAIKRAAEQLKPEEMEWEGYTDKQIVEMMKPAVAEAYDEMVGSDMLPLMIEHPHVAQFLGEVILDPLILASPKKGVDLIKEGVLAARRSKVGLVRKAAEAVTEGVSVPIRGQMRKIIPGAKDVQQAALEATAGVRHMSQLDPLWLAGGKYEDLRQLVRLAKDQAEYAPQLVEKAWEKFGKIIRKGGRREQDRKLIWQFADGQLGPSRDPETLEKAVAMASDPGRVRAALEAHLKLLDIREFARGKVLGMGQRWGYRPKIPEADFELANAVRKGEMSIDDAAALSTDAKNFTQEMETWQRMQVRGKRTGAELLEAAEVESYAPRAKKTPGFEEYNLAMQTAEPPSPRTWLQTLEARSGRARVAEEAAEAGYEGERWVQDLHTQWEEELYGAGRWIDLAKKSEIVRRTALYAKSPKVAGDRFINEIPLARGKGARGGFTLDEVDGFTKAKTESTGVKHVYMQTGEGEVGGTVQRISGVPGETELGGSALVMPEPLADHFYIMLGGKSFAGKAKFGYATGPGQTFLEANKWANAFWNGFIKPTNRIARTLATIPRVAFAPRNAGSGPQLLALADPLKAFDPAHNKMAMHLSWMKAMGGDKHALAKTHTWKNGETISWGQLLNEMQEDRVMGQLTELMMYGSKEVGPLAKAGSFLSDEIMAMVTPGGLPMGVIPEMMQQMLERFPKLKQWMPKGAKRIEKMNLKFRHGFSARAAASITEDYQHVLGYLAFRNGNNMLSRAKAVEMTDRYMYLYHRMSPIEKSFLNETFYFYNWISKSVKNNVKSLYQHPERMAAFQKIRQNMEAAWGGQVPVGPDQIPEYLQAFGVTAPPSMQPGPFKLTMGELMDKWKLTDPNDPNKRYAMPSLDDHMTTRLMFDFVDAMGLYVADYLEGSWEGTRSFDRNADVSRALTPMLGALTSLVINAPSDLPGGEMLLKMGKDMAAPALKPWTQCAQLFRTAGHDTAANEIMLRYACYRQLGPLYQVADEVMEQKGYLKTGDISFGVWPLVWSYPFKPGEQESYTAKHRSKAIAPRSFQLQEPGPFETK